MRASIRRTGSGMSKWVPCNSTIALSASACIHSRNASSPGMLRAGSASRTSTARSTVAPGPAICAATIDLDETYAWGFAALARLEAEMREVAAQIAGPGATVDRAVEVLEADPARSIPGEEAFREWMQALADKAIVELHGTHFDIPEPVRRIEARIAPTSDGGVYYTAPSEDLSRAGRIWWAVPQGVERFSTWRDVTTVYHEGVPGHHLQIAQTVVRADLLNRWQRLMCWVSGHGEGWALYAERLMEELGYLADAGNLLGMLDAQLLRAVRV